MLSQIQNPIDIRLSKPTIMSNYSVQKPSHLQNSGLSSNTINRDAISFQGRLTTLEQKVMEEIAAYSKRHGVETARVISRHGKLLDLKVTEARTFCSLEGREELNILGIKIIIKGYNETHIHSHPIDLPLSSGDVEYLLVSPIRKTIAVTTKGHYSSIERPMNFSRILDPVKYHNDLRQLNLLQLQRGGDLGLITVNDMGFTEYHFKGADESKVKEYIQYSIKTLQDFADKTGYRFEHNFDV